jgi:hypothetical protein
MAALGALQGSLVSKRLQKSSLGSLPGLWSLSIPLENWLSAAKEENSMIDFELLQTKIEAILGPETGTPEGTAGAIEAAPEPPSDLMGEVSQDLIDQYEAARPKDPGHGSHLIEVRELPPIIDASEFVATKYEPSPEIIKGLVHQGTKVVIGGGSKSFKTWVQLDAAISVAYGLPWMELDTVAGRVLFVNLEIKPEFFQQRVIKIMETRGIQQVSDRLDVWNLRGHSAPYKIILPRIIERIKEVGYALVVLDPVYKLYGNTDENSASEVAQLLNELERICVDTGAAVLFGAHYSKGNQAAKESIDRISGSGVFARDPDTIIPFTRHEEDESFVVEPILRNLPPMPPFVVTWNHPLMERNDELDPANLKQAGGRPKEHSANDILDLLPEAGLTNQMWEETALKTKGISRRTFFRLKAELKSADAIIFSRINEHWKPVKKQ